MYAYGACDVGLDTSKPHLLRQYRVPVYRHAGGTLIDCHFPYKPAAIAFLEKRMSIIWKWFHDTFELSRGERGNIRSMEGMRGLAVTAVFFVHYSVLFLPYASQSGLAPIMHALREMGSIGVDLFFVLSGYLIYGAALKRPQYAEFMKRRIRRIYPTFLAVFAVYLSLALATPHSSKIQAGLGHDLLYIAENLLLLPGFFPIEPLITVAWSLSYEMLYYAVIPLLVVGLGLYRWRRSQRIALFLALAAIGILVSSVFGGPIRAIMFFGGVVLYEVKDERIRLPFVAPLALLGAFASMLITTGTHKLDDAAHVALMVVTLPLFCFACFNTPTSTSSWTLSSWLSAWPLRWLGNMSYSYYLLHGLVLKAAFLALTHWRRPTGHETMLTIELLVPLYLLTIVVCAALFVCVERPFSLRSERPGIKVGALN